MVGHLQDPTQLRGLTIVINEIEKQIRQLINDALFKFNN